MARGEMVRFIAENNIENPVEIQKFDRLGYSFRSDLSSDSEYVFERKINSDSDKDAWFGIFYNNENYYYFIDNRIIVVYNPY